jgi:hypothetical protein
LKAKGNSHPSPLHCQEEVGDRGQIDVSLCQRASTNACHSLANPSYPENAVSSIVAVRLLSDAFFPTSSFATVVSVRQGDNFPAVLFGHLEPKKMIDWQLGKEKWIEQIDMSSDQVSSSLLQSSTCCQWEGEG